MPIRNASAEWNGNLPDGSGTVRLGSGAFEGQYSFSSRFEDGAGTNPEELIGAALAGCYSMALSADLSKAGYEPKHVTTAAEVHINRTPDGFAIPRIDLSTHAEIPSINEEEFQRLAESTKRNCPVSQLLTGAQITLEAKLSS